MFISIIILVVSFSLSLALTPYLRNKAVEKGIVDPPEAARKIHKTPMPTLGGLSIYLAFVLSILLVFFTGYSSIMASAWVNRIFGLLCASTIILCLGIYDDLKGAKPSTKILIQLIAALMVYYFGFKIVILTNPFGNSVNLGFLGFPLTIFWIIGITNAINLIDGIDGLAVGVVVFASIAIFGISVHLGNPVPAFLIAAMLGSCAGFLRYNFYPATIFLGDTGSQFLGFILAVISIGACQKSTTTVALVTPIIVLGLPIMETLFSFGRRASNGASPFQADMNHFHHRLLSRGYSQRQAVYILYTICVFLGIIGFIFTAASDIFAAMLLLFLAILLLLATICFGYFPRIQLKHTVFKKKVF